MTQKKITTTLSKNGKSINFINSNGKTQALIGKFSELPDEIFGQEVIGFQEGNKLVRVIWNGNEYPSPTKTLTEESGYDKPIDNDTSIKTARAPYNFIPQPLTSVPVPLPENYPERLKAFDRYLPDLLSGSISFELETLTHAFFGGQHEETKKTFILNGRAAIPSASQRGLLRAAMAIVSHGKFGAVDMDRRFYYRYNPKINNKLVFTIKAGLLKYKNGKFCIYESTFYKYTELIPKKSKYGYCGFDDGIEFGRWRDTNGYIVMARSTSKKNQTKWYIENPNLREEPIMLSKEDIHAFDYDFEIRSSSFPSENTDYENYMNLTGCAKNTDVYKEGVPIFFIVDKNKRVFIGNTKGFRLPFSQSMGDLIKKEFRSGCNGEGSKLDFAEGVFGTLDGPKKKAQRGRIRIENAYGPDESQLEDPKNLGILLSPKPSSGQLYLEQPSGVNTIKLEHKKYRDADAKLRGRKLYHHRIFNNVTPDYFNHEANSMQQDLNNILTIKPRSRFHARLHFMNLLPEELGALLWVLDLPQGYAHKLGMGKPLGLGSIKINNIQLNVCNTKSLYENVFDESGNLVSPCSPFNQTHQEFKPFKDSFEKFMVESLNKLGEKCKNLWDAENMRYYAAMLDTKGKDQPEWHRKTRYMGGLINPSTPEEKDDHQLWEDKAVLPHALYVRRANTEPFRGNANPYTK